MRGATASRRWYLQEIQLHREIADSFEETEVKLRQEIPERRREEDELKDLEKAEVELRQKVLEIMERLRAADELDVKLADELDKAEVELRQKILERQRAADELGVKFSADMLERVQADFRQQIQERRRVANSHEEAMFKETREAREREEMFRRKILERRRAADDLEAQL